MHLWLTRELAETVKGTQPECQASRSAGEAHPRRSGLRSRTPAADATASASVESGGGLTVKHNKISSSQRRS